jgi:hypothetical protein
VSAAISIVHVVGPLDEPICPKCGGGHEDDGGPVSRHGSWNGGPFYWECSECIDDSDGYPNPVQWGHA